MRLACINLFFLLLNFTPAHGFSDNSLNPYPISKNYKKAINHVSEYSSNKNRLSTRTIKRFDRCQEKYLDKLSKKSPKQAEALFLRYKLRRQQVESDLKEVAINQKNVPGVYNSFHDSLGTLIAFHNEINFTKQAVVSFDDFNLSIHQQRLIGDYMRQQKSILRRVTEENPELWSHYLKLDKKSYYFIQRNHYLDKSLRNKKIVKQELFENLSSHIKFKEYFKDNSSLAKIFKIPDSWGASSAGLQTNQDVRSAQKEVIVKFSNVIQNTIPKKIGQAKVGINKIKNEFPWVQKVADIPEFKPNTLKGKSIVERTNASIDIRFDNYKNYLPHVLSVGLKCDYQLFLKNYTVNLSKNHYTMIH